MQQPIVTNDVVRFTSIKESQYFDRKSARKDDKEIAKHIFRPYLNIRSLRGLRAWSTL